MPNSQLPKRLVASAFRRTKLLAVVILACACASGSLSATTLAPADFAQMATESELIVRGTVVRVEGQRTGGRQTIESLITLRVSDTIKGTAVTETTFRVPGGKVGPYRRVTVGAPQFSPGDEVILFLKGRAPAMATPYGLSQGVYRVSRTGGASVVTPAVAAGFGRVTRGDPARRPVDPVTFTRQVQAALAESGAPDGRRAIPRPR
jgi:hypothetical protein